MSEDICTCCTCGFEWIRGNNGSHLCSSQLRAQIEQFQADNAAKDAEIERLDLELRRAQDCLLSERNRICHLDEQLDKLLAEQSSTIELRKEIARLQTTIQGLVAEREEREPFAFIARGDMEYLKECGTAEVLLIDKEHQAIYTPRRDVPLYAIPPVPAVPEGWQLVPKEPTQRMAKVGNNRVVYPRFTCTSDIALDVYKTMLAAAPQNGKGGV